MNPVNAPQIDLKTMENLKTFEIVYNNVEDILFARPGVPRPATSFDWDGEIWVRIDPVTGEIVGLEIDDFESVFLKKHPDLAKAWQEAKSLSSRKRTNKYEDDSWASFRRIIYAFFNEFFSNNPTQPALGITQVKIIGIHQAG